MEKEPFMRYPYGYQMKKIVRMIKLTSLMMLMALVSLGFNTRGQTGKIDLKAQNQTILEIFREIEQKTDYGFFIKSDQLDLTKKYNVDLEGKSIEEVLFALLGEEYTWQVLNNNIALMRKESASPSLFQQPQNTVSGKVTDKTGGPLPGVTVSVKGTTTGTITNPDGVYTLSNVPPGATLVFSFVGMRTLEMAVAGKTTIDVSMVEDIIGIEEVVAVGYGTMRKSDVTGSIVRADLSKLQESPNVSLGQSLQGTVPGLNVGAVNTAGSDPSITIRGRTSISGGQGPLIVLDGIIYRGSLVDINPNDIESIDVLKDASAAAIYGSQASNGVILITSKTVKAMSKPIIEYTGSYTLQESTNDKMRPMNKEGFLQLIADRWLELSRTGPDLLQPNPTWDVSKYLMDANAVNGYIAGVETNWWDLGTTDNPYIQMHNVSIRGRSDLSNYFMSVGLTDQENLVINDTYNRYNIRVNLDTKVTDWLRVGTQTFFTLSDWSGIAAVSSSLPPVVPSVNAETGEYITYPYKGTLNPALSRQQDNLDKRYNFFGNFYTDVDIPFIKGLSYRLNFSQNLIMDKDFTFNPWGAELLGSAIKRNDSQYIWTSDHILTYKRAFGLHDVNSTFVYGVEKREWERTDASGSAFSSKALGYNFLGAADAARQVIASDAWKESSLYTMLRLAYTYNSRYSFTGTIRRDGFSGFGKNNKFAMFPSAAIAWRMSEESFIKDNFEWVDNLKLRLSYGSNGNRTVGRYQTLAKMSSTDAYMYGDGGPSEKGLFLNAMANDNLKWETTNSFNIGLELNALNNRIFGNLEYYRANTFDLLYNINIPVINNNISSIPTNIGKLANRGFELTVTGVPVQKKDFGWDITANFSINRNKVVSILGLDKDGDGKEDDLVASNIFIGHPYGVVYDFEQIGMWQIADHQAGIIPLGFSYGTYKVRDISGPNGEPDGAYSAAYDRKILGYTDPSYRFSIENALRYKNWELKAFINSIQGGKDFYYAQPGSVLQNPDNIYQENRFKWDYWTPENPNARYRQPGYFTAALGNSYSPYIQRSFVRLQNLTLSYRLPSALLKKAGVNNFKMYVTGTNLFTITDWDGWDPETSTGLGGEYPLLRTYSLGINFDF
jgi:TonB-dependent starch-binding outer membrane protein SusC